MQFTDPCANCVKIMCKTVIAAEICSGSVIASQVETKIISDQVSGLVSQSSDGSVSYRTRR